MSEARIWYSRDPGRQTFPSGCENEIVLTPEFFQEISRHPIPADLEAVRTLSSYPAVPDLCLWLTYRCHTARSDERIPLFGDAGLLSQLGRVEYVRPRKFREKLEHWLRLIRQMWPECPAEISADGHALRISRASAIWIRKALNGDA
jgi:Plasmid encoded RepA protein